MAAIRTRPLENLLKFKPKNKEKRKVIYKKLITALVQYERIETTINRCHDLSRVAERVSICRKNFKSLIFYAVAIRTAPVRRLVFAIRTGVRRFHRISL